VTETIASLTETVVPVTDTVVIDALTIASVTEMGACVAETGAWVTETGASVTESVVGVAERLASLTKTVVSVTPTLVSVTETIVVTSALAGLKRGHPTAIYGPGHWPAGLCAGATRLIWTTVKFSPPARTIALLGLLFGTNQQVRARALGGSTDASQWSLPCPARCINGGAPRAARSRPTTPGRQKSKAGTGNRSGLFCILERVGRAHARPSSPLPATGRG